MKVKDAIMDLQRFVEQLPEVAEYSIMVNAPDEPIHVRISGIDFNAGIVWVEEDNSAYRVSLPALQRTLAPKGMMLIHRPVGGGKQVEYAIAPIPKEGEQRADPDTLTWYPFYQEAYAHWLTDQATKGAGDDT